MIFPTSVPWTDMATEPDSLTVACHVRAPMLLDPIDGHVETLRTCEDEGAIDALLLRTWPEEAKLSDDGPFPEVVETFERFEAWAERQGVSVRPPFEVRTSESLLTDDAEQVLVTPLLCLALYREDSLVGVYPHSDGDETVTATEAIASLRTGELPPVLGETPDAGSSETCPECDGPLVQGQGLFACRDCAWAGVRDAEGGYVPLPTPEEEPPLAEAPTPDDA